MSSLHNIVIRIHSGLGNQLFQYAFGLYISDKTGQKLLLDSSFYSEYNPIYNSTRDFQLDVFQIDFKLADKQIVQKITNCLYPKSRRAFNKMLVKNGLYWKGPSYAVSVGNSVKSVNKLIVDRDIYLNGYWGSEKYFYPIKEKIRTAFKLKDIYRNNVDKGLLNRIKQSNSVSIHIRRGDYLKNEYFYNLTMDYYNKSVNYLNYMVSDIKLFVFSDDPEWVKSNVDFPVETFFVSEKNPNYLDMFYMTQCKHNIIANSTFSWWGAYLNTNLNKIVIAPKNWTNNKKIQKKMYEDELIYPPDWIIL